MISVKVKIKKLTQRKQKNYSLKNELKKLQPFDSICFRGKSHFEKDVTQSYLVFHPIYRYFKRVSGVERLIIFIFGNLKNCLMKISQLLLQMIIASIHN